MSQCMQRILIPYAAYGMPNTVRLIPYVKFVVLHRGRHIRKNLDRIGGPAEKIWSDRWTLQKNRIGSVLDPIQLCQTLVLQTTST